MQAINDTLETILIDLIILRFCNLISISWPLVFVPLYIMIALVLIDTAKRKNLIRKITEPPAHMPHGRDLAP